MASCVVIVAIICVLFTTVATIVAFATPNWLAFRGTNDLQLCGCLTCDCGLWLRCVSSDRNILKGNLDNCDWFFTNDFYIERALPDWFKAVQGLLSCAVASSLLSLLIGLFSLCCMCKTCNPHQAAGAFINLTFLLLAVAVCVFGAKAHIDHQVEVVVKDNVIEPLFGWSFWTAVAAATLALLSSILYFCVGRSNEYQYN
ncbi:uncharacterized protein LOC121386955 [Gigantopelta aegis]|uniref:uncharacterized protein LOC121386955 n=1 Tax=Gigantopelta aegis TaxID=1735272 RepID=UPI001B887ABF|nr:uncharacterized protein LOC121386955 [Gigantopelta aegis]